MLLAYSGLPFLSESLTHAEHAGGFDSWRDAFDPGLVPLRPMQHLFFWALERSGSGAFVGRSVSMLLHAIAMVLAFVLTRRLTRSASAPWVTWSLIAVLPQSKTLAWCAAIGWPGLMACGMGAVLAADVYSRGRNASCGAAMVGLGVLAGSFHQTAIVVPVWIVLWDFARRDASFVQAVRETAGFVVRPWSVVLFAVTATYVVYVLLLRENRYHGMNDAAAIPASMARATMAFCPEFVRVWVLDTLQGPADLAFYAAASACATVYAAVGVLVLTGGKRVAVLLLMAITAMSLAVFTAGFWHRYTYGAGPWVAMALAVWLMAGSRLWRLPLLALLALAWLHDSVVDTREIVRGGERLGELVAQIDRRLESMKSEQTVLVVEPPMFIGGEGDVPFWNFGLEVALARAGIDPERVRVVTTDRGWGSTDVERLSEARLAALIDDERFVVVRPDE